MPRRSRSVVPSMTSQFIAAKLHLHLALGGWRVWHEVTLGPTSRNDFGRADIWALRVSWSPMQSRIYEIKASRNDFKKDRDSGKWQKYLPHATEVFFACPSGLIEPEEVPNPAGLVYVDKNKKPSVVKKAEVLPWEPDPMALVALLMSISTPPDPPRMYASLHGPRREDERVSREIERETMRIRLLMKHQDRSKGKDAAKAVAKAMDEVAEWRRKCERMQERVTVMEELSKTLGIPSYRARWKEEVLERIETLKSGRLSEEGQRALRTLLSELGLSSWQVPLP